MVTSFRGVRDGGIRDGRVRDGMVRDRRVRDGIVLSMPIMLSGTKHLSHLMYVFVPC